MQDWQCDKKGAELLVPSPNQDIVAKVRFVKIHVNEEPDVLVSSRSYKASMKQNPVMTTTGECSVTISVKKIHFLLCVIDHSITAALRSILAHPKRIKSYAEARTIRNVGHKTALKVSVYHRILYGLWVTPSLRSWKLSTLEH